MSQNIENYVATLMNTVLSSLQGNDVAKLSSTAATNLPTSIPVISTSSSSHAPESPAASILPCTTVSTSFTAPVRFLNSPLHSPGSPSVSSDSLDSPDSDSSDSSTTDSYESSSSDSYESQMPRSSFVSGFEKYFSDLNPSSLEALKHRVTNLRQNNLFPLFTTKKETAERPAQMDWSKVSSCRNETTAKLSDTEILPDQKLGEEFDPLKYRMREIDGVKVNEWMEEFINGACWIFAYNMVRLEYHNEDNNLSKKILLDGHHRLEAIRRVFNHYRLKDNEMGMLTSDDDSERSRNHKELAKRLDSISPGLSKHNGEFDKYDGGFPCKTIIYHAGRDGYLISTLSRDINEQVGSYKLDYINRLYKLSYQFEYSVWQFTSPYMIMSEGVNKNGSRTKIVNSDYYKSLGKSPSSYVNNLVHEEKENSNIFRSIKDLSTFTLLDLMEMCKEFKMIISSKRSYEMLTTLCLNTYIALNDSMRKVKEDQEYVLFKNKEEFGLFKSHIKSTLELVLLTIMSNVLTCDGATRGDGIFIFQEILSIERNKKFPVDFHFFLPLEKQIELIEKKFADFSKGPKLAKKAKNSRKRKGSSKSKENEQHESIEEDDANTGLSNTVSRSQGQSWKEIAEELKIENDALKVQNTKLRDTVEEMQEENNQLHRKQPLTLRKRKKTLKKIKS